VLNIIISNSNDLKH